MVRYKFQIKEMPPKQSGLGRVLIKYGKRDGAKESERVIITRNCKTRCIATVWGHEEADNVIKLDAELRTKLALKLGDEVYLRIERGTFWARLKWYGSVVLGLFETAISILSL